MQIMFGFAKLPVAKSGEFLHLQENCHGPSHKCMFRTSRRLQKKEDCDDSEGSNGEVNVAIFGSGNWASAVAQIVGKNAQKLSQFNNRVPMYVHAEEVDGRPLVDIINEEHENVKYLKGHKLPENVVGITDVAEVAEDADVLIFVLPHGFVPELCQQLVGKVKPSAVGVSLVKGMWKGKEGRLELITNIISTQLKIPCGALMGANLANEVAEGKMSEATLGIRELEHGELLQQIFNDPLFRVVVVDDAATVEICGALKNIVAVAVGFCDGLKVGFNTKSMVMRLGLKEMIHFGQLFYPGSKMSTFLESCGVADLITTCYGGRNRRISEAFVTSGKSLEELERDLLKGQKLQGPATADEVNYMLKHKEQEHEFPLFTTVHRICIGELKPVDLIESVRHHPDMERSNMIKSKD